MKANGLMGARVNLVGIKHGPLQSYRIASTEVNWEPYTSNLLDLGNKNRDTITVKKNKEEVMDLS